MNQKQKALTDERTLATTLVVILIDTYGTEALNWTAPTIQLELEDDFNINLSQDNLDKLMAAVSVITTDLFYTSLPDFIRLCNALSGSNYVPGVFDPADAQEIAWGIAEALLLSPPDGDDPFAPEIDGYIADVLRGESFAVAPGILANLYDTAGVVSGYTALAEEDPALFETAYGIAADKATDIDQIVSGRLQLLRDQLQNLPLRNGKAQVVVDRLSQVIEGNE